MANSSDQLTTPGVFGMSSTPGKVVIDDKEIILRLDMLPEEDALRCVEAARRFHKETAQWPWDFVRGFPPRSWSFNILHNLATLVERYDTCDVHDYIYVRSWLRMGQEECLKIEDLVDAEVHFTKKYSPNTHPSNVKRRTGSDAVLESPSEKRQLMASEAPKRAKRIRLFRRSRGEKSTPTADREAEGIENDGSRGQGVRAGSGDALGNQHEQGDQELGPKRDTNEPSSVERGNTEQYNTERDILEPDRAEESRQKAKQVNRITRDKEATLKESAVKATSLTPDSQSPTSITAKPETNESISSLLPTPYRIPKDILDKANTALGMASTKYTSSNKAIADIRLAITRDITPLKDRKDICRARIRKIKENLHRAEIDNSRASKGRQKFVASQASFFMDQDAIKYSLDRYAAAEESSGAEREKLEGELKQQRAVLAALNKKVAELGPRNETRCQEIAVLEADSRKHQSERVYWQAMVNILGIDPTCMSMAKMRNLIEGLDVDM